MGKSLIITEKPSVAAEFAKVLHVGGRQNGYIENQDYVITWCVGHLVEMCYPEAYDSKFAKWKLEDLPFLPETYKYDVIQKVKSQYDIVHRMLQRTDVDKVYWAGDAGKEGQTIEENIRNFGGVRPGMEELRVWIDSQTEEEILRGIQQARPMKDYENLGLSGIMRTIEDYSIGINFSRVMSVKYGNLINRAAGTKSYTAIAVGRVMTCVLGMIVNREREIRDFKELPFYRVIGQFFPEGIEAEWKAVEGSAYFQSRLLYKENGFKEEKDAKGLVDSLTGQPAVVNSIEKNISKKRAPLLFNLAELQAECSKRFKISPDETLQIAQTLYEKKLTTYPRTDARVLSSAVAKEIQKNIKKLEAYEPTTSFAKKILEQKSYAKIEKSSYTDDSKITDHYAIIPTGQLTEYQSLRPLEKSVFDLIVRRFLSIFYPPAEYMNVKLVIAVGKEKFFSSARVLKTPGYLEIAGLPKKKEKDVQGEEKTEEEELSVNPNVLLQMADTLKKGQPVEVKGYSIRKGKTSPPKRYTSGSMVLAMENAGQLIEEEELREQIKGSGIGTSATRAEIIQKLIRNGYVALNKKTQVLTPENLGEMIFEVVRMTVPALLNPKMTASWEKGLDGITRGTVGFWDYRSKLEAYVRKETLSMIQKDIREELAEKISAFAGKNIKNMGVRRKIGVNCPVCEGEMTTTPFGFGCSNYKADKSGCNFSVGEIAGVSLAEEQVKKLLSEGRTDTIRGFKSKAGKKFDGRVALQKDEDGKVKLAFDFQDVAPECIPEVSCPLCGGNIQKTAFGYGCAQYRAQEGEGCKFAIGKIAGKNLSVPQVKTLLTQKKTEVLKGFKSKTGNKFDAALRLTEDGKIAFDFPDRPKPEETTLACPKCQKMMGRGQWQYTCACGFKIWHTVAKVSLTEETMRDLLTTGRTKEKIGGFTSKAGNTFEAFLKYEEDTIKFDF